MCSMGMVQVAGVTYRIHRLGTRYEIVRVLDDATIGTFRGNARSAVASSAQVDGLLVRVIAHTAVQLGRVVPTPERLSRGSWPTRFIRWARQLVLFGGVRRWSA